MRIVTGPLAEKTGIFASAANERVAVLLNLLGAPRTVHLPIDAIEQA